MSDDLIFKFKRSGELNDVLTEILKSKDAGQYLDKLKSSVEAMVMSDLEDNSGLLDSFERTQDKTVDQRRIALIFERRVRSEVESGLAGKPIDEYISSSHDQLLSILKSKLAGISEK